VDGFILGDLLIPLVVYVQGRQVVQLQAGRLVQQGALLQVQEELELVLLQGFWFGASNLKAAVMN
jgi:hypothetical protein